VTPEVPVRVASTTMLVRQAPNLQVMMVKRNHQIDFFSGAMVFPGGKVEPGDLDPAWARLAAGWADVPEEERGPRIAALRETFEECGVITATSGERLPAFDVRSARAAMEAGKLSFLDLIGSNGIRIDLTRLGLFARWLTPPIVPKRFDTFFYLIEMPEGQEVAHDGRETVENEWIEPAAALRLAEAGRRTIVFPTRMNLRLLAQSATVHQAIEAARGRTSRQVSPRVEHRGARRYLMLSPEDGYGDVEVLLEIG
jgi:8-oxo-dGTP pyrophosphatase MutT (NUDIX family)